MPESSFILDDKGFKETNVFGEKVFYVIEECLEIVTLVTLKPVGVMS